MFPTPAAATLHSVQTPPVYNGGDATQSLLYGRLQRGSLVSPYGTRQCDADLRRLYRHQFANMVQGAFAGLLKRVSSAPFEIKGDEIAASYYTSLLQNAQFGEGWRSFIQRGGSAYLTQNAGWFVEVIGPGKIDQPLSGAAVGIASLDTTRCSVTGDFEFPVLYQSPVSGKLHKMHRTRVIRLVDMPDNEETLYGYGMCALYRALGIVDREIRMGEYISASLDDKPKPGILGISGLPKQQAEQVFSAYAQQIGNDAAGVFGQTVMLYSIDPKIELKLNPVNFSVPPEKFDYRSYIELNVNMLALVLGVDKLDLWELGGGGGIGTGAQAEIMGQKSRGKAIADMMSMIERMVNLYILPNGVSFKFKLKDDEADNQQAAIDQTYTQIGATMYGMSGVFTPQEIRAVLADKSPTFREGLAADPQNFIGTDDRRGTESDAPGTSPAVAAPAPVPPPVATKDYQENRDGWESYFVDIVTQALNGDMNRRQLAALMRARLRRVGEAMFLDGLVDGGVRGAELDDADKAQIQYWLGQQGAYIDSFTTEVFTSGLTTEQVQARAAMWTNKTLQPMFDAGRISADRNGLYEWELGATEKHCTDCLRLNGQVHRLKECYVRGWLPKSDKLECEGYQCDCRLTRTRKPAQGRF